MLTVRPVPKFVSLVKELFGEDALKMFGNKERPQPRHRGNYPGASIAEE